MKSPMTKNYISNRFAEVVHRCWENYLDGGTQMSIPPAPMDARISYGPSLVPGARVICMMESGPFGPGLRASNFPDFSCLADYFSCAAKAFSCQFFQLS